MNMSVDWQHKRVLMTGTTGAVGAALARDLLRRGTQLHGLVRATSDRWRLPPAAANLTLHEGDLRDADRLRQVVSEVRPEIVFHLATGRSRETVEGRRELTETIVNGTCQLVEAVAETGCERIILAGSSTEYGHHQVPLAEDTPLQPAIYFGACKAAATTLATQLAQAADLPLVTLRLFSVYGPWEAWRRLVPTAICQALDHQPIEMTDPGFRRDFIYIDDVIQAFLLAAGTTLDPGTIINIGSGRQTTNEAMLELILEQTASRSTVRYGVFPPRPSDTCHWVADARRAQELLGWQAQVDLRQGVGATIDWMKAYLAEAASSARS